MGREKNRLTKEDFVRISSERHRGKYSYDKAVYKNTRTPVIITCPEHGDFTQTPKNHMNGQGCPKCGKEFAKQWQKYGYQAFLDRANERFPGMYRFPEIKAEYENNWSMVTVECLSCGRVFRKRACNFLVSHYGGCPCRKPKRERKTKPKAAKPKKGRLIPVERIREMLERDFPTIEFDLSGYRNTSVGIPCTCKKCGHKFKRSVNGFYYSKFVNICPECAKKEIHDKKTKTTEQFTNEANDLYGVGAYTVIGEYVSSNKKIRIKCNECGRKFDIEANSFLQGHGCPFHNCNSSVKEKEIAEYIRSFYKKTVLTNDRTAINGKELDIYLPESHIAFEFDGVFWHNENNKDWMYHLRKTKQCEESGIRLVHIFEDEWRDKREVWESMISNMLGHTERRIYARMCNVREVGPKECRTFLERNHLQGWCPSQIKYGLYYGNELVSVMTFGRSRHFIGNGKMKYELLRFCNALKTTVVGGASKLFAAFVKEYDPSAVVSYADLRWATGNMYRKLGFALTHCSKPNYFYVIKDKRKNRFNYRKSVLVKKYGCPEEMSEREFCYSQAWYRIYDCGAMVFKWYKK